MRVTRVLMSLEDLRSISLWMALGKLCRNRVVGLLIDDITGQWVTCVTPVFITYCVIHSLISTRPAEILLRKRPSALNRTTDACSCDYLSCMCLCWFQVCLHSWRLPLTSLLYSQFYELVFSMFLSVWRSTVPRAGWQWFSLRVTHAFLSDCFIFLHGANMTERVLDLLCRYHYILIGGRLCSVMSYLRLFLSGHHEPRVIMGRCSLITSFQYNGLVFWPSHFKIDVRPVSVLIIWVTNRTSSHSM